VDPAPGRHRRPRAARARQPRHRHAELRDPRPPELVIGRLRLPAPGLRERLRRRVATDRRRRPGGLQPAVLQPGRYYIKLALKDSNAKDLFNATGGQPYPVELAVEVLGRQGGNPGASKGPQPKAPSGPTPAGVASPNEPPATALLVLVGGGLAALAAPDTSSGPERLFATADQPADPALTLALVAVIALLGGLVLGTLAIVVLGPGRRRT
jgi:hypothetical protein